MIQLQTRFAKYVHKGIQRKKKNKKRKNWEQEIKILEQEIKKPTKAEFYKNLKT